MKKLLLSILLMLSPIVATNLYATEPEWFMEAEEKIEFQQQMAMPNAISFNVGYYSVENILTSLSGLLFAFDKNIQETRQYTTPTVGIRYLHTLNRTFTVGCAANFSSFIREGVRQSNGVKVKQNCNNVALSAECRFTYLRKGIFKMYGTLGLGVSYWNIIEQAEATDAQHGAFFNFNVSPLGMRLGKQVGGFLEFGLGYRGLVSAGVDVRF